ncbi:hypothetical protein [Pseudoduganella flava]|nr:hypothetical protein [Pseudoduganella flava]QGZ39075.1 hypothetical protein GO485_08475 [Pseudoduganella flava]
MYTLTFKALQEWAARSDAVTAPCMCPGDAAAGWISYPVTLDPAQCTPVGTLVEDPYAEATFAEYHPDGTRYDSVQAPIAPRWYPYNRCQVTRCRDCGRAYLQYTEAGGYFVDRRIRALRAALLVDAPGA